MRMGPIAHGAGSRRGRSAGDAKVKVQPARCHRPDAGVRCIATPGTNLYAALTREMKTTIARTGHCSARIRGRAGRAVRATHRGERGAESRRVGGTAGLDETAARRREHLRSARDAADGRPNHRHHAVDAPDQREAGRNGRAAQRRQDTHGPSPSGRSAVSRSAVSRSAGSCRRGFPFRPICRSTSRRIRCATAAAESIPR